jgi:hypothetical protein
MSHSGLLLVVDWILRSNLHPLQFLKADPYPMDLTYGQIHYRWIYRWIIQRFEIIRGCTPYFDKDSLLLRVALAPGAKAAVLAGLIHLVQAWRGAPSPRGLNHRYSLAKGLLQTVQISATKHCRKSKKSMDLQEVNPYPPDYREG